MTAAQFDVTGSDMNSQTARKYESPLRQAQAEETRQRILAAVARLFETAPEEALSFDAIAEEAGVQRRTVFRHFTNKDTLLEAFWAWTNQQVALRTWPETEADLVAMPPETFAGFDRHEGLIRAALTSRSGREMRLRANPERQAAFRRSLADVTQGLDPLRAKQAVAVIQLLYSAPAWHTLKDYWNLDGQEAGEAVSWAISTLLDALRHGRSNQEDLGKQEEQT
ncbi:TetR/AcrR family transcriptional regulator [Microvirga makkahensis]|nr:TetR/AcrR family transcriptional regulator [Microvirga makkahensis]